MRIAILGATGATGRVLVEQALASGHEVTAVARNPADIKARAERLTVVQAQATSEEELRRVLPGHQVVISAIGSRSTAKNTVRSDTMRALVAAMKAADLKRLVWLSASGVGDSADQARKTSFVFGRIIMPLFLKHVYADAAIADDMLRASDLEWVLVRPVGLNDKGLSGKTEIVPIDRGAPRSYISRADVAQFMLEEAVSGAHLRQSVTIC